MNNYLRLPLAILFLTMGIISHAIETHNDSIIPNASYFGKGKRANGFMYFPTESSHVIFCSFDGNPIKSIKHNDDYTLMRKKIDPSAPKPQPTSYKINYWPGIVGPVNFPLSLFLGKTIRKGGRPGYYIIFYDKNGNIIDDEHRYEKNQLIRYIFEKNQLKEKIYTFNTLDDLRKFSDFPLDLSLIKEFPTILELQRRKK